MFELSEFISQHFAESDYPCIQEQRREFAAQKDLRGLKVLHIVPVFKNSLVKLLPLLDAGVDLCLAPPPFIPSDATMLPLLKKWGLRFVDRVENESFDVVLDCCASHAHLKPRYGFAELTRSGRERFLNSTKPCILVDESPVKLLEDSFGTGDGFWRGLEALGEISPASPKYNFVLFGYGKVGRGIARQIQKAGHGLTIIDLAPRPAALSAEVTYLQTTAPSAERDDKILTALGESHFIVTATGVAAAVEKLHLAKAVSASPAKLVNMGAEDEFGPAVNESRVLAKKRAINFLLEEPTRLRFLDPIFALHNQAALRLLRGEAGPGLQAPDSRDEVKILQIFSRAHDFDLSQIEALGYSFAPRPAALSKV